ncbi:MAG: N-acetylmuramoyl-L-alanine amidase [Pseudonocardiales bacterium]|jgi:N-acetylmuramoyl-L-alanine amidase|nr:N-acetylmuramoyl-L-alanine amidase [Pseudonocardiales bacterium]MDT4929092.1 N-acetylmuramoyl-L-alanine amidase [Pseudonocardiales bacterium]
MQALRRGATGSAVAEVRAMLASIGLLDNTDPHTRHVFDEPTELAVRHFQQRRGISVDGAVGGETYATLTGAHWKLGDRVLAHESGQLLTGDDVAELQTQLIELGYHLVRADGVFELSTAEALRGFQRDYGLLPDGICGPGTMRALRQLGRRVVGGRPQLLRDMVAVADSGPSLLGKRIVLDAGHGGNDPGVVADGVTEAELVWDLASRLEGRLTALGVQTWPTRGPNNGATDEQRAQLANDVGADLVLSLHIDGFVSPLANGIAAYYYGAGESSSTIGERLADLAQRELVARTGMLDNHIHGKSWALLRLTRMPAVRVELGYLTAESDRSKLCDPRFRDTMAEGLLVAVQRLYLPIADDPPTGVMRIPARAH